MDKSATMVYFVILFTFIVTFGRSTTADVTSSLAVHGSKTGSLPPGVASKSAAQTTNPEARQYYFNGFDTMGSLNRKRCPLCDSSVYSYCGEKLLHDACCCTNPYQYPLPYKCQLADCGFLHSKSCKEHRLISNCCCSDEYRSILRGEAKTLLPTTTTKS